MDDYQKLQEILKSYVVPHHERYCCIWEGPINCTPQSSCHIHDLPKQPWYFSITTKCVLK